MTTGSLAVALAVPLILVWMLFLARGPVTGGALTCALLVGAVLIWLVMLLPASAHTSQLPMQNPIPAIKSFGHLQVSFGSRQTARPKNASLQYRTDQRT